MKICFVGSYNQEFNPTNTANSPAGNQVQSKIIEELILYYGKDSIYTLSASPQRSWPNGPLFVKSNKHNNDKSLGYWNIPVLKTTHISLRLFRYLNKNDLDIIIKYNISFPEALALRVIKKFKNNVFICIIIQDVNYPQHGLKKIYGLLEWCAVRLCSGFDFIVPVTSAIVNDFKLPASKAMVFNGGISRQTEAILKLAHLRKNELTKEIFAVFAGALEQYNGIDVLIEEWIRSDITLKLHIFGIGSLSDFVSLATSRSESIIYHGFVSEEEVSRWQVLSSFNICLRYSKGIAANYFFPSKFFNIMAAQGTVVTNFFIDFPETLKPFCSIVCDDLKNLRLILVNRNANEEISNYHKRRNWLNTYCRWSFVVDECNTRYNKSQFID